MNGKALHRGQALVELVLLLPLLAVTILGGLTLGRLALVQAEVRLAAIGAASSPDPVGAVRDHLGRNRLVDPARAVVQVQRLAQLQQVTVTYTAAPAWWPSLRRPSLQVAARGARGRALLCLRPRR